STTAIPQIPWPMETQAPPGDPIATVATPVPKANSSTTSSAWFVWRPGARNSIRTGPGAGRDSPLRRRITNVIRYVIDLWQRAVHKSTADGDLRERRILPDLHTIKQAVDHRPDRPGGSARVIPDHRCHLQ